MLEITERKREEAHDASFSNANYVALVTRILIQVIYLFYLPHQWTDYASTTTCFSLNFPFIDKRNKMSQVGPLDAVYPERDIEELGALRWISHNKNRYLHGHPTVSFAA